MRYFGLILGLLKHIWEHVLYIEVVLFGCICNLLQPHSSSMDAAEDFFFFFFFFGGGRGSVHAYPGQASGPTQYPWWTYPTVLALPLHPRQCNYLSWALRVGRASSSQRGPDFRIHPYVGL